MFTPERIATEMINFYKTATLNACNSMALLQEQAEKIYATMVEQSLNGQKEGTKLWQQWLENNKKTREEFNKMMGEGFDRAQEFFAPGKAA